MLSPPWDSVKWRGRLFSAWEVVSRANILRSCVESKHILLDFLGMEEDAAVRSLEWRGVYSSHQLYLGEDLHVKVILLDLRCVHQWSVSLSRDLLCIHNAKVSFLSQSTLKLHVDCCYVGNVQV